jgi:hypothetical protein
MATLVSRNATAIKHINGEENADLAAAAKLRQRSKTTSMRKVFSKLDTKARTLWASNINGRKRTVTIAHGRNSNISPGDAPRTAVGNAEPPAVVAKPSCRFT